jgi:hypothetical protein
MTGAGDLLVALRKHFDHQTDEAAGFFPGLRLSA